MKLTEETTKDYDTVGRLRDQQRLRNRKIMSVLAFIGCMLLFVIVMAASVALYVWVDESMQDNLAEISNMDAQAVEDPSATYTQAELDAKLAEAVAEAKKEGAEEVLDALQENINSSSTIVGALRPLYEDDLIVASNGQGRLSLFWISFKVCIRSHSLSGFSPSQGC